jgi:hypothetical protein
MSVKLSIKRKYRTQEAATEYPILTDVNIGFMQTNETIMSFPIKVGDDVWVSFSERSLDTWKRDGGIVDPNDPRKHHLSDAVATPMYKPIANGLESNATDIMIQHNDNVMTIAPDGNLTYTNSAGGKINLNASGKYFIGNNSEEFLSIVSELIQLIVDAKTNTMLGPQPFINNPAFSALKGRLDSALKQ